MPRRNLNLILAVVVLSYLCYERADHNRYGRYFAEAFQHIHRSYVEPVDDQSLFDGALEGMTKRLDEYSSFISRKEAAQFQSMLEQHFGGIGIEVALDRTTNRLMVMTPLAGSPAYEAGVRAGDRIVAIEGRSTEGFTLEDAVKLLRGPTGQKVRLRVLHEGDTKPVEYTIERKDIRVASVLGDVRKPDTSWNYFLPGYDRIGYVRITQFGEETYAELAEAIETLMKGNCRGLILDMRDNPGGLLTSAKDVCELFLPAGKAIVSTRGRGGMLRESYEVAKSGPYQTLPIVILVNGNTASAAEVVAACLQDHHRALVVGQRTYGKGTVQDLLPVEGGRSMLKLTIATFWRPSLKNIHRFRDSKETDEWGVKASPGLEVPMSEKEREKWSEYRRDRDILKTPTPQAPASQENNKPNLSVDPQLRRAIEALEQKITPQGKPQAA